MIKYKATNALQSRAQSVQTAAESWSPIEHCLQGEKGGTDVSLL